MNTALDNELKSLHKGVFIRIINGKRQIHRHGAALSCERANCRYAGQPTGTMPPLQRSA